MIDSAADVDLNVDMNNLDLGIDFDTDRLIDAALDMDLDLNVDENFASDVDFGLGLNLNLNPVWNTFDQMFGSSVFRDDIRKLTEELNVMVEVDDALFGQNWRIHWQQEVQDDGSTEARWDIDYINSGWDMNDIRD